MLRWPQLALFLSLVVAGCGSGELTGGDGAAVDASDWGSEPSEDLTAFGDSPGGDVTRADGGKITDSGLGDGAPPDAMPPSDASLQSGPIPEGPYDKLSDSGLYVDIVAKLVRPDVRPFEPAFALWTDGAAKRRWIWLPPGESINTRDMARWMVPPGTTAWKEFRDPVTGKRLETRVVQRRPSGDFWFATFIWNQDDSEAWFDPTLSSQPPRDIPSGCARCDDPPCEDFPESCHVVPQATSPGGSNGGTCGSCHNGETGKLLGFSAVQLSHTGDGVTLARLVAEDRLSEPPPPGVSYPVPGTPIERAAIGTLHANCGHCHDRRADQNVCYSLTAAGDLGFAARVHPGDQTVEDTALYQSAVGVDLRYWVGEMEGNFTSPRVEKRIAPGDPLSSAVWVRMSVREWGHPPPLNDHQQMPPLGTNEVDPAALGAVELWIERLP